MSGMQSRPDQAPRSATSDLGLHCLLRLSFRIRRVSTGYLQYCGVYFLRRNYKYVDRLCVTTLKVGVK